MVGDAEEDSNDASEWSMRRSVFFSRALDAPEPCLDSRVPDTRGLANRSSSRGGVPRVSQLHCTAVTG